MILACHVDNCTITGNSQVPIQSHKDKLKKKYSLTDLGANDWLLGIKITRDLEVWSISLSQSLYIDSILMWFNFMDVKPSVIPMDPSICFTKDQSPQTPEEIADMCKVPYCEAIGSLNHCAVATWPDIAFPVLLLAWFMEIQEELTGKLLKGFFCYLSGTKNWELVYGMTSDGLEGFTDADRSLQEHWHAISRYVFLMNGGAISWSSKKQSLVTLSTAESEYIAATYAAKEALWLHQLIEEIYQPLKEINHSLFWPAICNCTHKRQVLSCINKTYWH